MRRHTARRASPAKPLEPKDFVQRLSTQLGTESAGVLVKRAFEIVESTGKPNRWIFEVKRVRDRGIISSSVAHYLIYMFVEKAMTVLIAGHSGLSRINARMERIEREHGLKEGEYWGRHDAPPEFQALDREWNMLHDELFLDILVRNGELAIAEAYAEDDDEVFMEGRDQIFGQRGT